MGLAHQVLHGKQALGKFPGGAVAQMVKNLPPMQET